MLLLLCALGITGFVARGAAAADMVDAVRTALTSNPDIGIAAEGRRIVGYELRQAEGGFLPTVDLQSSGGIEFTESPTTRGRRDAGLDDDDSVRMPTWRSNLTLRQLLYDGSQTRANVERQKSRLISAARRVRESSAFVAIDAIEAYLNALRQRELLQIARDNVATHEETLELVERKALGGAATIADVQQAQSRLATAQVTFSSAEARLLDADATYARIIGEAPGALTRPRPDYAALPPTMVAAVSLSQQYNPTVVVTRADMETVRQDYNASKSGLLPRFDLQLSGNADRNTDGTRGSRYDGEALVQMNYNLFRGNRDVNRRQELIHRIAESRQQHNRAMRFAEEEMRLSWNGLQSARQRLQAQVREVDAKDLVRSSYRQQFDLGGRSLLELLDSENEYFIARSNLVTTEFVEIFNVYRILSQAGSLLSSLRLDYVAEGNTDFDPLTPDDGMAGMEFMDSEPDDLPMLEDQDPNAPLQIEGDDSAGGELPADAVEVIAPDDAQAMEVEAAPVPSVSSVSDMPADVPAAVLAVPQRPLTPGDILMAPDAPLNFDVQRQSDAGDAGNAAISETVRPKPKPPEADGESLAETPTETPAIDAIPGPAPAPAIVAVPDVIPDATDDAAIEAIEAMETLVTAPDPFADIEIMNDPGAPLNFDVYPGKDAQLDVEKLMPRPPDAQRKRKPLPEFLRHGKVPPGPDVSGLSEPGFGLPQPSQYA